MTDPEAPGAVIVHLFGPPPAVEGAPEKKVRPGQFCWPHWPLIDKVSRLVTCKRCKSPLDPVDVLLEVAERHDEYVRMMDQTRTLRRELEQLHAEEKKVKARTRSHSRKDALAAVAAEREKMSEQLGRAVFHAREVARLGRLLEELVTGKRKTKGGKQ